MLLNQLRTLIMIQQRDLLFLMSSSNAKSYAIIRSLYHWVHRVCITILDFGELVASMYINFSIANVRRKKEKRNNPNPTSKHNHYWGMRRSYEKAT